MCTSIFSPVGLKEAALDSPTFRATTLHFSDQVDFIEKWLDGYAKAATKLSCELAALESVVNNFLSYSTHPLVVSEAVVDHDYTLLAMRRCGEGSKDLWSGLVTTTRKLESLISEPIRDFIQEDLRHFKVSRAPEPICSRTGLSDTAIGNSSQPRPNPESVRLPPSSICLSVKVQGGIGPERRSVPAA